METAIGIIVVVLLVALLPLCDDCSLVKALYKDRLERKYEQDLFDKVRWIVIQRGFGTIILKRYWKSIKKTVRDDDLFEYIFQNQRSLNLENKFYIDKYNENEKFLIKEILESYKNDMVENLFSNSLATKKEIYRLNFFEYYMFSLYCFLGKMDLRYGVNGKQISNCPCTFSEYDFYFHKLLYIINAFCATNKNICQVFEGNTLSHWLEKNKEELIKKENLFIKNKNRPASTER